MSPIRRKFLQRIKDRRRGREEGEGERREGDRREGGREGIGRRVDNSKQWMESKGREREG